MYPCAQRRSVVVVAAAAVVVVVVVARNWCVYLAGVTKRYNRKKESVLLRSLPLEISVNASVICVSRVRIFQPYGCQLVK